MNWHVGEYDHFANFTNNVSGVNQVTFINSSTNAINFYWNFGDGDTSTSDNPTHLYLTTGTYIVTLIAEKCAISDTAFKTINITYIGVSEIANISNIIVYPNPSITTLEISIKLTGNLTYKIFNLTGEVTITGTINNLEKQISVSTLSNGIYYLQLFDGNKSLGQQIFVKSSK